MIEGKWGTRIANSVAKDASPEARLWIHELTDQRDLLYVALSDVEWSAKRQGQGTGPMGSGGNGPLVSACPSCGGICPKDPRKNEFTARIHGHDPDCHLKKGLAKVEAVQ